MTLVRWRLCVSACLIATMVPGMISPCALREQTGASNRSSMAGRAGVDATHEGLDLPPRPTSIHPDTPPRDRVCAVRCSDDPGRVRISANLSWCHGGYLLTDPQKQP